MIYKKDFSFIFIIVNEIYKIIQVNFDYQLDFVTPGNKP